MTWSSLRIRIRALLSRNKVERDLDEELTFHLEMQAGKNIAGGMNEAEANDMARLQFGGLLRTQEKCRDERGVAWVETIVQDVRYALRTFTQAPGYVLTVALMIGLGLGLNTALFTVFNAYALRPLAVRFRSIPPVVSYRKATQSEPPVCRCASNW